MKEKAILKLLEACYRYTRRTVHQAGLLVRCGMWHLGEDDLQKVLDAEWKACKLKNGLTEYDALGMEIEFKIMRELEWRRGAVAVCGFPVEKVTEGPTTLALIGKLRAE